MAEFSAPFDGSPVATELQWSRMARRWGGDGVHATDQTATALKVTASGTTTVAVAPGRAFVNGFYYDLDATKNLSVTANAGGAARLDLVVLRADQTANSVTAQYKTGGATPPPLTQDEAGVWEIPLAQCTVAAGSSVVTAANVADRRYLSTLSVIPSIPGSRPPSLKHALLAEENKLYMGDGAGWKFLAAAGVEDAEYTPQWTAGSTVINWGASAINYGRYQAVGKRVSVTIQLSPAANPPQYNDAITVSLPPGLPAVNSHRSLFSWQFLSGNGEGSAVGVGMVLPADSQTRIGALRYGTSSGSVPNAFSLFTNSPFDIRTGDLLTIDGSYWTV
ncbi:hypothetical protein GPZ77_34670 (plasmid) [Streptomyces sp. QHH-9511]|uniref:hypothetical protein n=1 Tax=Streptomyces sp. QHH-9511 TaxID=2684468 RepID=UPI001318768A|nr:hypothetical protein [Streptomyces sp. QHH-9511]QGZ53372.1 hypothetical protein GPZ77_34670 [Streptomyces sp. QHH-9511]